MVSGILYAVFPLGTYFVRLALLSLIAIIECALPLFLKPISPLLDWIMNSLRDLINRLNTETEGYFQRYNQEPPREEIESMATLKPVLIFLYILLGALCVFILYSIWKAMVKYHREHQEEQADEIKQDWSSGKAWNWAAKNEESCLINNSSRKTSWAAGVLNPDRLARLYAEFLQLAEQAGQARRPSKLLWNSPTPVPGFPVSCRFN